MRARNVMAAVAAVSTLFISAAQAQSQRREAPLAMPPHQIPCSPDARVGVGRSDETTGSRTLSDQLAESKGVICPPAGVDPGITAPPIGGGRMPVIPPPGTPGGDPYIQPK